MNKLLSVNETSRVLGVSTFTIRRLVKRGELHSVRVGKRLLLPETEVARVMAEGCEEPRAIQGGSNVSNQIRT
jgi:excisionase family DNA binding protein